MSRPSPTVFAAILLGMLPFGAAPAVAQTQQYCVCLINRLDAAVSYQVGWSDTGAFDQRVTRPTYGSMVCLTPKNAGAPLPQLVVTFNKELGGGTSMDSAHLEIGAAAAADRCDGVPPKSRYEFNYVAGSDRRTAGVFLQGAANVQPPEPKLFGGGGKP